VSGEDDILLKFPQLRGHPAAMAGMCEALRKAGHHGDALALGRAAIAAAPGDMEIRDRVHATLSAKVPPFHAGMLQDDARNRCYADAIARAVKPGMTVLEIGTGAGLLAMLAARAGAEVVSCEANPMIAAAATAIVAANGLAGRVRVVAKRSTDLRIGEDLPRRADLLIGEIFGTLLFDEGVVASYADARARLLVPGAPAVPRHAELRCALIERDAGPAPIGLIERFDLSHFNLLTRPQPTRLNAARRTAEQRSAPVSALRQDFGGVPPFGFDCETIALISDGGRADAIAQWLRIDFGDGVRFENDPFAGAPSHWGAPVFPLPAAIDTISGQIVQVTARRDERALFLKTV
jgi:type II protein arginine methyltransferase